MPVNRKTDYTAPRNFDENVDYDGIYKLINKEAFDIVLTRYTKNNLNGMKCPDELEKFPQLKENKPQLTFEVTDDKDNQRKK